MMRISTNWLNDYVDITDQNLKELADKITNAGVNVETVEEYNNPKLVVGQILDVKEHPDSDHLHICNVDVGEDTPLQIVCGAPNVKENMKVIVSLVGCKLPEIEIKQSKIRGVESNGMMCALSELGLEEDTPENHAKGIHELPNEAVIGANPYIYLGLDDTIYNLDLNPNRMADCTNHLGFAYETAAVLGRKVELPDTSTHPIQDKSIGDELEIDVLTDNCKMYNARKVVDITIKESPQFIKDRLTNAGMRPINNVVDISNYIMLEYGQPLHFFDADKLGKEIVVRMANNGEKIKTLDNIDRKLTSEDIVIADQEKPVCIAGIMGGENTEIDENTKNVVIESAIFDPLKIRYTSIRLDLKSEASTRYEHGLNYEYTIAALDRACNLLEKYADGKVLSDKIMYDNVDKTPKVAKVSLDKINTLLNVNMSIEEAKRSLDNLGFPYEVKDNKFTVTIPNRRNDVTMREDLIEEIGRLYGYDHIIGKMPKLNVKRGEYKGSVGYRKKVSKRLRTLGLNETRTYTLISEEMDNLFKNNYRNSIKVLKPLSLDKSIARQSLLPSLLNVANYNFARNTQDVNIYEIANIYFNDEEEETMISMLMSGNYITNKWQHINVKCDFYILKGIVENLLNYLGFEGRYYFEKATELKDMHPGATALINVDGENIGYLGKVHPNTSKKDIYVCEMSLTKLYNKKVRPYKYKELNKYPTITKDVAFVTPKDMLSSQVEKEIKRNGSKLLKNIEVFDLYQGENIKTTEKSIAYKLYYEDETRTLTTEEVNEAFNKMIEEVTKKLKITIRQ